MSTLLEDKARIAIIELLNDQGMSIIWIDNTFYQFIEFIPSSKDCEYITLTGKNITTLIESSTNTTGFNTSQILHLEQTINSMPNRRREFSPHIRWNKYVCK